MGFHICEYCRDDTSNNMFASTSSGDTILTFSSGRSWSVPDMIVHYVADHKWRPPEEFIEDVMKNTLLLADRFQTKSMPVLIGYLSGPFETGDIPEEFVLKLHEILKRAGLAGSRTQYRG